MSGVLNSLFGTARPSAAAPLAAVTELAKTQIKVAGTTNLNSGPVNIVAGRCYIVLIAWDPTGSSVPTIFAVTDGANTYTQVSIIYPAPSPTSAGTGVLSVMYKTIASSSGTRTITPDFNATITAKCMVVLELLNSTGTNVASATSLRGTGTAVSYTAPMSPSLAVNDYIITWSGLESPNAPVSGSTSTVGGTWSAVSSIATSGGGSATNIGLAYQYKIVTSTTSTQTIAWTLGANPNNWNNTTWNFDNTN
jgi:hypothetical protein